MGKGTNTKDFHILIRDRDRRKIPEKLKRGYLYSKHKKSVSSVDLIDTPVWGKKSNVFYKSFYIYYLSSFSA